MAEMEAMYVFNGCRVRVHTGVIKPDIVDLALTSRAAGVKQKGDRKLGAGSLGGQGWIFSDNNAAEEGIDAME